MIGLPCGEETNVMSFPQNTGTWRTDRRTELLYQYRAIASVQTFIFTFTFRLIPVWMILSDLWPRFQGHDYSTSIK